jgi:glycosyltransferase involved in cell wall biosynthesis
MRVAFDASSIGSGLGGDETMARALVRALVRGAGPDDEIDLLFAAGVQPDVDRASAHVRATVEPRSSGPRHFLRDLPRWVGGLMPTPEGLVSLTHAPCGGGVPVALMVPDLSFEHLGDAFPRPTRLRLRSIVRRQVRRAAGVLTISEFCRSDLISTYGLGSDVVHHVPLHVDPPEHAPQADELDELRRRLDLADPFVLYVGNLHPRKNLPAAVDAVRGARRRCPALADHRFVVAGATWWGSEAHPGGADDWVRFLGRVSDDDRHLLVHAAEALIYPSRFEGFGLPPLEAMARGTPVVASNATSIPEVCGDAALLVDPDDIDGMADALVRATTDDPVRSSLIAAGHRRARHYSVERTAHGLWEALRAIALEPAPIPAPTR